MCGDEYFQSNSFFIKLGRNTPNDVCLALMQVLKINMGTSGRTKRAEGGPVIDYEILEYHGGSF